MNKNNWKETFASIQKTEGNTFIKFLLDAGIDVNALNGKTILSYGADCFKFDKSMDEKKWKKMFISIWKREGNTFIQFLLYTGLDVNALNKYGKTMLSYAAECGNLEFTESLVQNGADVNVTNSDGSKPLHIASRYGHKNIVKFFFNTGMFVDSYDREKWGTPLHYAAAENDIPFTTRERYQELVHFLVDSNADLNAVNRNGDTPLLLAARNSRKHIVELLIKLGANVECYDKDQWTVLHHSCRKGWSKIVHTLLDGRLDIDLNSRTSQGFTPLFIAASSLHTHIIKLLIESGADIKCLGLMGETVLHRACKKGWLDVVKSLVNKGCDLNAKDSNGDTPLLKAAHFSHSTVVEYLIESGANVECCNKYGWTVLHQACEKGWLDVVKSLVNTGCELNAKESGKETPLLLAARHSHSSIVEYLIESGADFNSVEENGYGHTVMHYACEEQWLNIVKCLVKKGCDLNSKDYSGSTPLLRAGFHSCSSIVEYLIESGADVNSCNEEGLTILHYACGGGLLNVVKSLIKKGFDLNNARDQDGRTLLYYAVQTRNLEIMEQLLKAGADCNAQNQFHSGSTIFNDFIQIHLGRRMNDFIQIYFDITAFNDIIQIQHSTCLEYIILFLENGAYFQLDGYSVISEKPLLKKGILQDVKLCTQAIINKFNNGDLPKIYEIPMISKCLPSSKKLKIVNNTNVAQDIEQSVMFEIQSKGYCNILNVRSSALSILSVRYLIEHYVT